MPANKKVVGCHWVYRVKYLANGKIYKFKVRHMAKGYTQTAREDYHTTFSRIAEMVTFRTILSIASAKSWHVHQLDINSAFLHGNLPEEVYLKLPQGHPQYNSDVKLVCQLHKSIYGLK